MKYMDKEITFIKNKNEGNFTYITPNTILTTNKQVSKVSNYKTN